MKPENVNPKNFKVLNVLYDDEIFSVASGIWKNRDKVIGLRWNGDDEYVGYPKTFGHPMWFILSDNLINDFLKSLLDKKYANNKEIINFLKERYT